MSSTTVVTLRELTSSKYGFSAGPVSEDDGDASPPATRAAADAEPDDEAVDVPVVACCREPGDAADAIPTTGMKKGLN